MARTMTSRMGPGSNVQLESAAAVAGTERDCRSPGVVRRRTRGRLPVALLRLLALVAPPSCLACGAPPPHAAEVLCPACRSELRWLRGPLCPRCALPAHVARTRCPAQSGAPHRSWAPLAPGGPAAVLVHALKLRGVVRAAAPMAA